MYKTLFGNITLTLGNMTAHNSSGNPKKTMSSLSNYVVALFVASVMLQAAATPLSLRLGETSRIAPPVPLAAPSPPLDNGDIGAGKTSGYGSQSQLARGIDAAYVKAHVQPIEDVTTLHDGTDRIYRMKTSMGVNMCLNWRDVDRFDPGKGKALYVLACNR